MNIGILIFCRMSSQRLFGKCLMDLNGHPALYWLFRQLKPTGLPIVVCTSINPVDDQIANYCKANDIEVFRGPETDMLKRMNDAISKYGFSHIIRITGDDLFVDPKYLLRGIREYNGSWFAYTDLPKGSDYQIISADFIRELTEKSKQENTEYLTWYFNTSPSKQLMSISPADNFTYSFDLDTPEDAESIRFLLKGMEDREILSLEDILSFAERNRDYFEKKYVIDDKQRDISCSQT